jgi:hypothetical protein
VRKWGTEAVKDDFPDLGSMQKMVISRQKHEHTSRITTRIDPVVVVQDGPTAGLESNQVLGPKKWMID